jgi:hypothetical protein
MSGTGPVDAPGLYDTLSGGDGSSEQLAVIFIFPRLDVFHMTLLVMLCNLLLFASCFFFCGAVGSRRRNNDYYYYYCNNDPQEDYIETRLSSQHKLSRHTSTFNNLDTRESLTVPLITPQAYVQHYEEPRLRERKPTMAAVQIV